MLCLKQFLELAIIHNDDSSAKADGLFHYFVLCVLIPSVIFMPICPFARPLWVSPRQVMLVPVNPSCEDYAKKVNLQLPHLSHISFKCDYTKTDCNYLQCSEQ